MTGHAEQEASFREALRSGAESIQKPFSHDWLMRVVRRALDAAEASIQSQS